MIFLRSRPSLLLDALWAFLPSYGRQQAQSKCVNPSLPSFSFPLLSSHPSAEIPADEEEKAKNVPRFNSRRGGGTRRAETATKTETMSWTPNSVLLDAVPPPPQQQQQQQHLQQPHTLDEVMAVLQQAPFTSSNTTATYLQHQQPLTTNEPSSVVW